MSYKIKDGILYHNGEAEFAIGQSYYPSFHHAKYPVPPEGDRIGEMKKDFRLMKEMGFNFIRIAGIGDVHLSGEEVCVDTPFADTMLNEALDVDIAMSVRLQGYVFNLHDNKNYLMIDKDGNEQDITIWSDFIRTSLNHSGSLRDNYIGTKAVAEHFKKFESVVSFQIYNEPHYPLKNYFDYHPDTIAAYRKWLVKEGHMSEEEAKNYNPPRAYGEQEPKAWALWRIFAQKNLAGFLGDSSDYAKEAAPNLPTYTCFTPNQICHDNALYGVDFFDVAKRLDMGGFTCYYAPCGSTFYKMLAVFNICESSSALYGKKGWCVELSSINKIPHHHFTRQSYAAVGAGLKGIVYYQWRGDYPSEATPIPNGCGFVNYDGTKMDNYDNASNMIALLKKLSSRIVNAEKMRCGMGIFVSDYAYFMCDAIENDGASSEQHDVSNLYMSNMYHIYKAIIKRNLPVDFLRAEHLEENVLDVKYLFVPHYKYLSDSEKKALDVFVAKGGKVYEMFDVYGDVELHGIEWEKFHVELEIDDVLDSIGVEPLFDSNSRHINLQTLKGSDYHLLCMTNTTPTDASLNDVIITSKEPVKKAVIYESGKDERELKVENNRIFIPEVTDGGFIIVK